MKKIWFLGPRQIMRKKNIIYTTCYILISIWILSSCSSMMINEKKAQQTKTQKTLLIPVETVAYPDITDITKISYYYDEKSDNEYLIYFNDNELQFIIFDFKTGNILSKFTLNQNIHAMYVYNMDSIFVAYNTAFGDKSNVFGLLNGSGEVLDKYNFTGQMVVPDAEKLDSYGSPLRLKVELSYNPYSFTNFIYFEGCLYLSVCANTTYSKRFSYPSLAIAPISGDNNGQIGVFEFKLGYPPIYKQHTKYSTQAMRADYMDFAILKDEYDITNIVVSYPLADTVERHRLVPRFMANDDIIFDSKKTYMDSAKTPQLYKYDTLVLKNVVSKYKSNKINSFQGKDMSLFYNSLKYDKLHDLFYRVVRNFTAVDQYSLIVTDRYLNILDEIALETTIGEETDYKLNFFVTKDGIALVRAVISGKEEQRNVSTDIESNAEVFVIKYKY